VAKLFSKAALLRIKFSARSLEGLLDPVTALGCC
jgi:hypothetical protein